MNVVPSVFATNTKEYVERFLKTSKISKRIHVDVMDGKFVRGKSPPLIFILNKKNDRAIVAVTFFQLIPSIIQVILGIIGLTDFSVMTAYASKSTTSSSILKNPH